MQRGLRAVSKAIPEGVKGKSFLERGTTPLEERYYGNARIFTEEEKQQLLRRYDPTVRYTDVTAPLYAEAEELDDVTTMQYIDVYTWLRGDILVKADRMSMAHSLELRVPFLDKEVFDGRGRRPGRPEAAAPLGRHQVRPAPGAGRRRAAGHREPQEARLPDPDPGLAQGRDVRVGPRHPHPLGRRRAARPVLRGASCWTRTAAATPTTRARCGRCWSSASGTPSSSSARSTPASPRNQSALLTKPVVGSMVA